MTASSTARSTTVRRRFPPPDAFTTAGAAVALVLGLVGAYVETPWRSRSDSWGVDFSGNGGWSTLAVIVALIAVTVVLVGLATARARAVAPERTAGRSLLLAALGVLALAVFYTGAPPVLAVGAAGLGLDARRRLGRLAPPAAIALALAPLTIAAAVYLAFTG
jgi:hypothetical protein